jgi:hypothetical protein
MTVYRYVVHSLIPAFEALGWSNTGVLVGTHHGSYSDLLEWKGEGDPQEPPELTERKRQIAALEEHMMETDRSF